MQPVVTGIFGKLPAHGDFIHRNLPSDFITTWDEWLQHYIAGSQEQMGEQWLDIYLTSPIWRFMFSEGTIDEAAWSGVMLPSVDKIGRYFPFSVITRLPSDICALEFLLSHNNWLDKVEEISLQGLNGDLTVDELMELVDELELNYNSIYSKSEVVVDNNPIVISLDMEDQIPASVSNYMLDAVLLKTYNSYSAWTTKGSELIDPGLFYSQGLPPISGISSMLDGQWAQWKWQQPYKLDNETY